MLRHKRHTTNFFAIKRHRLLAYTKNPHLNKLKAGTPTLSDLRPIMISCPIIKMIESMTLQELKAKLESKISKAQVGFLPKLGTQIHLLCLLSRVRDIQSSPSFRPMAWSVAFIVFRSAFDKVNLSILFPKLQRADISLRTLNILKVLYSSYHYTLSEDKPKRINSRVAQGLLSITSTF